MATKKPTVSKSTKKYTAVKKAATKVYKSVKPVENKGVAKKVVKKVSVKKVAKKAPAKKMSNKKAIDILNIPRTTRK